MKHRIAGKPRLQVAKLGVSMLLGTLSFSAQAADNDYPAAIQRAVDQGVSVEERFDAVSGMTGWVLSQKDQYSIVFTTADQQTLISGALIDTEGRNLTEQYSNQYIPKPGLDELEESAFITEGTTDNPSRILYAFFDPNCPFCHLAWKALQPYEQAGLQVRWIPVAYLAPSSRTKAAALLQAEEGAQLLKHAMANVGNEPDEKLDVAMAETTREQLLRHMDLMQRFGIRGTPGLVWQDTDGQVQIRGGMPKLSALAEITGLPEQPIEDPELMRLR